MFIPNDVSLPAALPRFAPSKSKTVCALHSSIAGTGQAAHAKPSRLPRSRRDEAALAEHSAIFDLVLAEPSSHSGAGIELKQNAASPVVNQTGTQPCKLSLNSSGALQSASRRSNDDRALGSHPRPDQRGHLRRPRAGRLSHPLGWSARRRHALAWKRRRGNISPNGICRTRARPRRRRPNRNPCNRERRPAHAI